MPPGLAPDQACYGYAKDQVRKEVDDWLNRM